MAGRYALALFQLARDGKSIDAVMSDLNKFKALLAESVDLQRLVRSPVFTVEEQGKALSAVLARAGVSGLAANFLKLVAAKRRLFAVPEMIAGFEKLVDSERGVTRAEVTVAEPLNDSHTQALKAALAEVTGGKNPGAGSSVEAVIKVDPAIIGGLVVKLGSRMVDSSLRTKLNSIRTRMKEVG